MRARWLGILASLVLASAARAAEAPHDGSFSDDDCGNCHSLYNPSTAGGTDYSPGCLGCHSNPNSKFNFPWAATDQGRPGFGGNHHSWSAFAVKPSIGANVPYNAIMVRQLVDGKLQCSVCHDTHRANGWAVGNVPDVSMTIGTAAAATGTTAVGGAGTGQMMVVSVATNSPPRGYRIRVQTFGGTSGTFIISHDWGLPGGGATWMNWTGSAWAPGTIAGAGKPFNVGTTATQNVTLDDTVVTVRWQSGVPKVGDYWDLLVSYPFLRLPVAQLCVQCHQGQVMGHQTVGGLDPRFLPNGTRVFSHPVGEALNANGKNTDRTIDNPDTAAREMLDANGAPQTTGDGNATNDLKLVGGVVECTTCHAVHNADSNSLTVDKR